MLNFFGTRFAVGHRCFVVYQTHHGMWRIAQEQVMIEQVTITTYNKSNFAVVIYKCSDGVDRKEGMQENGEPLTNVLFGTIIEAKSACAARNQVKFS